MNRHLSIVRQFTRGSLAAMLTVVLVTGLSLPEAGDPTPGNHAAKGGLLDALGSGSAWAETSGEPQTLCPVLGGKIDQNIYLDHEGKRIYFCCASCKEAFLKDPAKYTGKASRCGGGGHVHGGQE